MLTKGAVNQGAQTYKVFSNDHKRYHAFRDLIGFPGEMLTMSGKQPGQK